MLLMAALKMQYPNLWPQLSSSPVLFDQTLPSLIVLQTHGRPLNLQSISPCSWLLLFPLFPSSVWILPEPRSHQLPDVLCTLLILLCQDGKATVWFMPMACFVLSLLGCRVLLEKSPTAMEIGSSVNSWSQTSTGP